LISGNHLGPTTNFSHFLFFFDSFGKSGLYFSVFARHHLFKNRSRSHITTDHQSASSSWCLTPFGAGDQMLHLQVFESSQVKVKVILRPTVCRPVRLGVRHPPGTRDQFFPILLLIIFFDSFGFVDVGRLLIY
jgi:hypothetical protein